MKLKSKLRLALELGLVTSALPLLLLGCGGGGGGDSKSDGRMSGQFWTDLTGFGISRFSPGALETASSVSSPAKAFIETATFSGGRYAITGITKTMSGVAWATVPEASYFLTTSGWTVAPSTLALTATGPTTFTYDGFGFSTIALSFSTVNLSGLTIMASPAVPAVDTLGYASSVSSDGSHYPPNSYAYQFSGTSTSTATEYWVTADPSTEVTTFDSSVTPTFTHANFTPTEFAKHASTADPICVGGFGLVRNTGDIYYFYELTLKGGVHPGTNPTCKNSNIGALFGTYVVSFVTIMNTTVVTFSSPTGTFGSANTFGQFVIGVLPLPHDKAYFGGISPAGTSTSTSYSLNKTAMDAVMQAWGVEKF